MATLEGDTTLQLLQVDYRNVVRITFMQTPSIKEISKLISQVADPDTQMYSHWLHLWRKEPLGYVGGAEVGPHGA